jgi:ABC-type transport system substrate-binding protein
MSFNQIKHFFSLLKSKGWPIRFYLKQFFRVLKKLEKIIFFVFLTMFLMGVFFLGRNVYLKNTEIQPAEGGAFVEGVLGQPRFINPIYSQASDIDRDLAELIFSGLMKYDETGKIVPDLAEDIQILEEGRIYEISLKENLFWQNNLPLSVDDVIFTVETIQNSDVKSPLRPSWLGVEMEKISENKLRFKLKNPYGPFLESLTLKIIPKNVWKDVSPQNFPLVIYNLKPIGSGPYKLKNLKQDNLGKITSLDLVRNPKYYGKTPYLTQISFRFFDNEEKLIKAAQKKEIQGLSILNSDFFQILKNSEFQELRLSLPRYFVVFFNPDESKILSDQKLRQAINYGTNKKEILEKALAGYGKAVDSPILPEIYKFNSPSKIYEFNPEKAKEIFNKAGFVEKEEGKREKIIEKETAFQFKSDLREGSTGKEVEELQKCLAKDPEVYPNGEITGYFGSKTKEAVIKFQEKYKKEILEPQGFEKGTGLVFKTTRQKLNELCAPNLKEILPLKFSLVTVNQTTSLEVANILKNQWKVLGLELEIKALDISQLEEVIKERNYEGLLFGEVLGIIPDPFPFWHSAQIKDPGLNLAIYQNKIADKLLEEARQTFNENERKEKLENFQDILIEDVPALFLYNPDYLYFVSKEIKGINEKIITDPSKRFSGIENWYIKTKRAWK